jgi:phospholipid/cholesterol/gamma-HCH transport system substrate-binding protein
MNFKMRFADQIVGLLIVGALAFLILAIFMIGSKQRWFAKDMIYRTHFESAIGLSVNMPVQYKGFTIGNIKSFDLTDDDKVEVFFSIYGTYLDRIRQGSLVNIQVSPIGMGNTFVFHPGVRNELIEGDFIPSANSDEGRALIAQGWAYIPSQDDSITQIITRVNVLLGNINTLVRDIAAGTDTSSIGRTVKSVESAAGGISDLVGDLKQSVPPVVNTIDAAVEDIRQVIADINVITTDLAVVSGELANPDSLVLSVLDTDGPVYTDLERTLNSLAGTLGSVEQFAAGFPPNLPLIVSLLEDLSDAIVAAQDVIIALQNNPLLRKGIPSRPKSRSGGISPRDIAF